MIRELRSLGYRVELGSAPASTGMIERDFRPWFEELKRLVPTK